MRVYPKGCRNILVQGGTVYPQEKIARPTTIQALFVDRVQTAWVVVKPRGRNRWWLFVRHWAESPRLVAFSNEPDTLVMRALLSGDHG